MVHNHCNLNLAGKLGVLNCFFMLHTLFTATVYKVYMLHLAEEKLITRLLLITSEESANSLKLC